MPASFCTDGGSKQSNALIWYKKALEADQCEIRDPTYNHGKMPGFARIATGYSTEPHCLNQLGRLNARALIRVATLTGGCRGRGAEPAVGG